AGDQEWTRWIQAGSTNLSSGGPMEVHFGFGDLEQVDSISVTWPDQRVSMVERVDTRQHLVISRR
ncbi:MAG: ASPIC/UnbV domain-containing protein, partial [Myxococcota bacterium]